MSLPEVKLTTERFFFQFFTLPLLKDSWWKTGNNWFQNELQPMWRQLFHLFLSKQLTMWQVDSQSQPSAHTGWSKVQQCKTLCIPPCVPETLLFLFPKKKKGNLLSNIICTLIWILRTPVEALLLWRSCFLGEKFLLMNRKIAIKSLINPFNWIFFQLVPLHFLWITSGNIVALNHCPLFFFHCKHYSTITCLVQKWSLQRAVLL